MLFPAPPLQRSSLSHYRVFFIQFRPRRGPAVISGETRAAVTKWTWYLPVLKKQTVSLMLGTQKYPYAPFFPRETKGKSIWVLSFSTRLSRTIESASFTAAWACMALFWSAPHVPRPQNLSNCAFQMGINSINSTH